MTEPKISLADGMRQIRLSYTELWQRVQALGGGPGTVEELQHHVESDDCPDDHEHNVIAQALNDIYLENDRDHPVAYRHLYYRDPP